MIVSLNFLLVPRYSIKISITPTWFILLLKLQEMPAWGLTTSEKIISVFVSSVIGMGPRYKESWWHGMSHDGSFRKAHLNIFHYTIKPYLYNMNDIKLHLYILFHIFAFLFFFQIGKIILFLFYAALCMKLKSNIS